MKSSGSPTTTQVTILSTATVASEQAALPSYFSPPGKMAAPAVVCSFLERYGPALDLPEMTFPQLERYLRDTTAGERSAVMVLDGRRSGTKLRHLRPEETGGHHHRRDGDRSAGLCRV
uniref:Uncharacterized protein n=1 Tax=Oryzias melastigma TaxID=30732 RepID=A0A3B3B5M9_ORYME